MATINRYKINEMTCEGCLKKVTEALQKIRATISVNLHPPEVLIEGSEIPLEELQKALSKKGPYTIQKIIVNTEGKEDLSPIAKEAVSKDYQKNQLSAELLQLEGKYYCPMLCEGNKVYDENVGCPICGMDLVLIGNAKGNNDDKRLKKLLIQMTAVTIPVFLLGMFGMSEDAWLHQWIAHEWSLGFQLVGATIVLYLGRNYLKRAWISFKTWHLNMFSLIGLGAIVAYLFSIAVLLGKKWIVVDHYPVYFESVAVIFTLMVLGQWLEARTHKKTRASVEHLFEMLPSKVHIIKDEQIVSVELEQVKKGDWLLVKPGEKIPTDGRILSEHATINESFISGEAIPIEKKQTEFVFAGSINAGQSFQMEVTQLGNDTTLAKIVEMVNKASLSRAPIQRLADRISQYFVPTVLLIAVFTFIGWGLFFNHWLFGIQNAISVLVIACPCALGLATPVSIAVGIGKAAEHGILIKQATALEQFRSIDILLTDKTGTLTEGRPSIVKIYSMDGYSENQLLQWAMQLNSKSEHPLAQAFQKEGAKRGVEINKIPMVATLAGKGVQGLVDGKKMFLGNESLMLAQQIAISQTAKQAFEIEQQKGHTISFLAVENELVGWFAIGDMIKQDARSFVSFFKKHQIAVEMLTGDHPKTAQAVANQLQLSNVHAQQLPEQKLDYIKQLQSEGNVVAMIGDGINDSPALAQANISIAMGSGAAISQDFSSITIIQNNLSAVERLYTMSNQVVQNIRQNLFFAFVYNIVGIFIATGIFYSALGWLLTPMIAALAMCLSSVSVLTNALRLKTAK